jgi:hypothetical protein
MFEPLRRAFGSPQPGTASAVGADEIPTLRQLHAEGVAGIYAGGLLSLLSRREELPELYGWEALVPEGARLIGSTAFGWLVLEAGQRISLVDAQTGEVLPVALSLGDFILELRQPQIREGLLREELFTKWRARGNALQPTEVVSPTPAIMLGGDWSIERLRPAPLAVVLAFNIQALERQ